MKKIVLAIFVSIILSSSNAFPQVGLDIYGGMSVPNNKLNYVFGYNPDFWTFYGKGISLGWHLGARFNMEIADDLYFAGGLGWNRFSDVQLEVKRLDSNNTYIIDANHDIIPISAGLKYYITNSIVKFYVLGNLTYNFFTTHGDFIGIPAPNINLSESTNRGGFSCGAGLAFELAIISPFLEFNYSLANLIGKESNEETKAFFNISLGISLD